MEKKCHKYAITEIFHSESAVSRSSVAAFPEPAIAAFPLPDVKNPDSYESEKKILILSSYTKGNFWGFIPPFML